MRKQREFSRSYSAKESPNRNGVDGLITQQQQRIEDLNRSNRVKRINPLMLDQSQIDFQDELSDQQCQIEQLKHANAQHMTEFINRLIAKNKINAKNAFDIPIIHLHETKDFKGALTDNTWKRLSSTLENDYKIYGYRVDATHNITYKMLQSITRHDNKEKNTMATVNSQGEERQMQKQLASHILNQNMEENYYKYLQRNLKNINIFQLDIFFNVNPILESTRRKFDQNGLKGLLLNSLDMKTNMELDIILQKQADYIYPSNAQNLFIQQQIASIETDLLGLRIENIFERIRDINLLSQSIDEIPLQSPGDQQTNQINQLWNQIDQYSTGFQGKRKQIEVNVEPPIPSQPIQQLISQDCINSDIQKPNETINKKPNEEINNIDQNKIDQQVNPESIQQNIVNGIQGIASNELQNSQKNDIVQKNLISNDILSEELPRQKLIQNTLNQSFIDQSMCISPDNKTSGRDIEEPNREQQDEKVINIPFLEMKDMESSLKNNNNKMKTISQYISIKSKIAKKNGYSDQDESSAIQKWKGLDEKRKRKRQLKEQVNEENSKDLLFSNFTKQKKKMIFKITQQIKISKKMLKKQIIQTKIIQKYIQNQYRKADNSLFRSRDLKYQNNIKQITLMKKYEPKKQPFSENQEYFNSQNIQIIEIQENQFIEIKGQPGQIELDELFEGQINQNRKKISISIRDAKQKIRDILFSQKNLRFKSIYDRFLLSVGFITPALCFLTVLHLANEHNLILSGQDDFVIEKLFE